MACVGWAKARLRRAHHLSELVVGMVGTLRFAHPTNDRATQSFLNTIDAIHPVISAMKAVISP